MTLVPAALARALTRALPAVLVVALAASACTADDAGVAAGDAAAVAEAGAADGAAAEAASSDAATEAAATEAAATEAAATEAASSGAASSDAADGATGEDLTADATDADDGAEADAEVADPVEPTAEPAVAAPAPAPAPPPPPVELPRGGRSVLPEHRVVAHYGNAEAAALGVLGETDPARAMELVEASAHAFRVADPDLPVLPAAELIVTVAQRNAGSDGLYRSHTDEALVREWLEAVRAVAGLLVLDIQPGRSDFLTETRHWEALLVEPDVHLALDPEWRMAPGERPGRVIGQVGAHEVNRTLEYVSGLVARHDLPDKLVVLHQFQADMLPDRERLIDYPGVDELVHLDGFGPVHSKLEKYAALHGTGFLANGFKLFLDEDPRLMTAAEVVAMTPRVHFVSYQ